MTITRILASRQHWGLAHGIFWKCASLASKLVFLLLIVYNLPEGVYLRYVFYQTLCLLAARALTLGVEDHLPVVIRGELDAARQHASVYLYFAVVAWSSLGAFALTGHLLFACLSVTVMVAGFNLLGGVLKTVTVSGFEVVMNMPPFLFLLLVWWMGIDSVASLLAALALGMGLSQLIVAVFSQLRLRPWHFDPTFSRVLSYRHYLGQAMIKMASTGLMILHMRAAIIWPVLLLGLGYPLLNEDAPILADRIAITLSFVEAIWQFVMVFIHRDHARYYRIKATFRRVAKDAARNVLLMGLVSLAWLPLFFFHITFIVGQVTPPDVAAYTLLIASLIPIIQLRYYLWLSHRPVVAILIDVALVMVQVAVVLIAPALLAIALATSAFSAVYLLVILSRLGPVRRVMLATRGDIAPPADPDVQSP